MRRPLCPNHKGWVAHSPGFPVKLSELAYLHAAFLTESRTRCRRMDTRTGNPGQAFRWLEWGKVSPVARLRIPLKPTEGLTRISCTRIHSTAACAAFCKESRRKVGEFTKLHRKSGGMGHPPLVVSTEGDLE